MDIIYCFKYLHTYRKYLHFRSVCYDIIQNANINITVIKEFIDIINNANYLNRLTYFPAKNGNLQLMSALQFIISNYKGEHEQIFQIVEYMFENGAYCDYYLMKYLTDKVKVCALVNSKAILCHADYVHYFNLYKLVTKHNIALLHIDNCQTKIKNNDRAKAIYEYAMFVRYKLHHMNDDTFISLCLYYGLFHLSNEWFNEKFINIGPIIIQQYIINNITNMVTWRKKCANNINCVNASTDIEICLTSYEKKQKTVAHLTSILLNNGYNINMRLILLQNSRTLFEHAVNCANLYLFMELLKHEYKILNEVQELLIYSIKYHYCHSYDEYGTEIIIDYKKVLLEMYRIAILKHIQPINEKLCSDNEIYLEFENIYICTMEKEIEALLNPYIINDIIYVIFSYLCS